MPLRYHYTSHILEQPRPWHRNYYLSPATFATMCTERSAPSYAGPFWSSTAIRTAFHNEKIACLQNTYGFKSILVRPLPAIIKCWRQSLFAFSTSAFSTILQPLLKICLANVYSRDFVIFSIHAPSLSRLQYLQWCGSVRQHLDVDPVPVHGSKHLPPDLIIFLEMCCITASGFSYDQTMGLFREIVTG